jgi:hypothetical protein
MLSGRLIAFEDVIVAHFESKGLVTLEEQSLHVCRLMA